MARIRTGWSSSRAAIAILGLLVLAGVALRTVALFTWWPVSTAVADSWPYASHAVTGLFRDGQHPPGYSTFLRVGGLLTRDVAVYTIAQHLLAIVAGVVLFFAIRRLCGSPWPALVGAAAILLGGDQIYLEHAIASEALFIPLLAISLYAVARALDAPDRWWPWPLIAAVLLGMTAVTRTAALFMLPIVAIAFVLARPRPWLPRWRPVVAFGVVAAAMVLSYGAANAIDHDRFELTTNGGWHLYGRVAPFAWCGDFTPPKGTAALCERSSPATRPGTDWYLYDAASPATRLYGYVAPGSEADEQLGAFARAALLHQPKTYLEAVWTDVKGYFFPDSYPRGIGRGSDLDSELNWSAAPVPQYETQTLRGMQEFFDPFTVDRDSGGLRFLHDYQRTFRVGATLLTIATVLILLGLLVGPRRNRIAVLVLGVGGLAMLILPTFSIIYVARYSVPPAALIVSGGAVGAMSLIELVRRRLSSARRRRQPAATT